MVDDWYHRATKGNNEFAVGTKTYIEINGKKYDATTGKMIEGQSPSATRARPQKPAVQIVDGFRKHGRTARAPRQAASTAKTSHATTRRSQTLSRTSVQKPATQKKTPSTNSRTITRPTLNPSSQRVTRAKHTERNSQVRKFSTLNAAQAAAQHHPPVVHKKQVAAIPLKPAPKQSAHSATKKPTHKQTATHHIEQALASATSHAQPHYHHSRKRRHKIAKKIGVHSKAFSAGMAVLSILVLGGFFAVQNVPQLSMRVAAARAGFDATMPGYQPAGFGFSGPINYEPGRVTVSFSSNADSRAYSVTQQTSNWNSDALLANFIDPETESYQSYLDKGRTLYIYDGSNATWVDDGIWYKVEGKSGLSTDQLIRIASSM